MKLRYLVVAVAVVNFSNTLVAQEAVDKGGVLEEIVVTVQKRNASIQSVPATVIAFDESLLASRNVVDLRDLQGILPNTIVGEDAIGLELSIRGVSNGAGAAGDSAIALHTDGVYTSSLNILFYDMQRVETVYGPQGTLYGRNATGGALNAVTNEPDATEFYGNIEQTFGNYSRNLTKGMINVPIIEDTLAIRLAGLIEERDGYTANPISGSNSGKIDGRSSARFSVSYQPTDSLSIVFRATKFMLDSVNGDSTVPSLQEAFDSETNTVLAPTSVSLAELTATQINAINNDPWTFPRVDEGKISLDQMSYSVNVEWDFDRMALTYIGGINNLDSGSSNGGLVVSTSTFGDIRENEFDESSHEFRLSSNSDGNFTWLVGLFTYKSERTGNVFVDFNDGGFVEFLNVDTQLEKATSDAIFTSLNYKLTDKIKLSAGARYSEDEKQRKETIDTKLVFLPFPIPFTNDNQKDFDSTDWAFGVDYQISLDNLLYLSTSSGYKAGGLNSASAGLPTF
ncbi:MAG: TonB-dependent receptor [Spongiibacteraceae bacterium]|nr:TonB-dependent receptor [Spongiibacteraceae bacterium]